MVYSATQSDKTLKNSTLIFNRVFENQSNLVRKLIIQSTKGTIFFPKTDIIQEFFENNKDVFMDRKGRVYKRWSTGRYEKVGIENH